MTASLRRESAAQTYCPPNTPHIVPSYAMPRLYTPKTFSTTICTPYCKQSGQMSFSLNSYLHSSHPLKPSPTLADPSARHLQAHKNIRKMPKSKIHDNHMLLRLAYCLTDYLQLQRFSMVTQHQALCRVVSGVNALACIRS